MKKSTSGFTIVELLIVIVVIAILAAITIVAFNNVQQRARDSARLATVKSVYKGILAYQAINGNAPTHVPNPGSSGWEVSSDPGFLTSINSVVPQIPTLQNTSSSNRMWYRTFPGATWGCPQYTTFFILRVQGLEVTDGTSKSDTGGCDTSSWTANMLPASNIAVYVGNYY